MGQCRVPVSRYGAAILNQVPFVRKKKKFCDLTASQVDNAAIYENFNCGNRLGLFELESYSHELILSC